MTDDQLQQVIDHGTAAQLAQAVELARLKAKRATTTFGIAIALVVALALAGMVLVIRSSNHSDEVAAAQLDDISAELTATRLQLATATQTDVNHTKCELALQGQVRSAALEHQAAIGALIIVLAVTPSLTRQASVEVAVQDLHESLDGYRASVNQLTDWQALPTVEQQPCPIQPVG